MGRNPRSSAEDRDNGSRACAHGPVLSSHRNLLFQNTARSNNIGISLQSSATGNTRLQNKTGDGLDPQDGIANGIGNLWVGNVFGTANQGCIH